MGIYIRESVELFLKHWKLLVLLSLASTAIMATTIVAGSKLFESSIYSLVNMIIIVYAYRKILGQPDDTKTTLIDGLRGWIASLVLNAIIILVLLVIILVILPVWFISAATAVLLALVLSIGTLLFLAKFIYIPVLAALDKDIVEILKGCLHAKWGPALRAVVGEIIFGIAVFAVPITLLVSTAYAPLPQIVSTGSAAILLRSSVFVAALILSIIVYIVGTPILWMFPLASARDAIEGEVEKQ